MKAPTNSIAVVIVTHNGARYLQEQLESIAAQQVQADAIFLVDDRSTDGSKALVVEFFSQRHPIPLQIVEPSPAPASDLFTRIGRNFSAGMAAAVDFVYVALADQDDVWEPDRLARQRSRLASTGALLTAGNGILIDSDGVPTGQTLRDCFPVLVDWESASSVDRLRSVLREPMATGAAVMVSQAMIGLGVPIPPGWLHDRWLSLVAASRDALDVDDHSILRYRVYSDQTVGLRGRFGKAASSRVVPAVTKPYLAARKLRDLSVTLRAIAQDDRIRSELSFQRLVRTYLGHGASAH